MEINLLAIFATVAIAHFLALLSPGPDFVLIVKSSIKHGGKKSIGVAAGIASANAVYISLCLAGVGSILAASVTIMVALKIAGGLFLIYLAFMALKAQKSSYAELASFNVGHEASRTTVAKEFFTGFMSGILNPKNLLFYLSLFTVVLTSDVGLSFKLALAVWMTLLVFLWDVAIVYFLSTSQVRQKFAKAAYYIDKFTGALLGIMGLAIVRSALTK